MTESSIGTLKCVSDQGNVMNQFPPSTLQSESPEIVANYKDFSDSSGSRFSVLVLDNVFTPEECQRIIVASESYGFESLVDLYNPKYRNNDRIMVDDTSFCETWFQRMLPFIENYSQHSQLNSSHEEEIWNKSVPIMLNERLRICRYPMNGIFCPHFDGCLRLPEKEMRSRLTVMAYLNDIPEERGGATRFLDVRSRHQSKFTSPESEKNILAEVQPIAGRVVIFPHDYYHDGQLCTQDNKYVIRSDLMYQTIPLPPFVPPPSSIHPTSSSTSSSSSSSSTSSSSASSSDSSSSPSFWSYLTETLNFK